MTHYEYNFGTGEYEESTPETTRSLPLTTTTMTLQYEEIEGAVVSYLELIGKLNTNQDFIVSLDLPLELNDDGLVEFDVETTPVEQMEFNF